MNNLKSKVKQILNENEKGEKLVTVTIELVIPVDRVEKVYVEDVFL